ncbi:DNA repair and meiosis protein Mre11 [Cryptosporidium felis]|nr:DNA repair and meiosis protein Mre11 [Cryptosporidium felis]
MDLFQDGNNTFKILVCTDTHTGFKERDRVRSNDSLITLEEIFIIGKKLDVDLILHSGDLFDVAKPSKYIMYNVMNIIRKYCMGSKKIKFKALTGSNSSKNCYNWENGDTKVSIPFFGIHGNHDDPGEQGLLSPLDILESARFINYIGKNNNVDDIEVSPVLLEKGTTKLAIYGIGNIKDERLYRSLEKEKVKFLIPENFTDSSNWFSILLFHQNRKKGNFGGSLSKDSIPESFLPDFLDLIIWGHEHECIKNPVEIINKNFFILQPGSSIATSHIASESVKKHVVLLEVQNGAFKTTPIPLISPRTFIHENIVLSKHETHVESVLFDKISELINMAKSEGFKRNELVLPQSSEIREILTKKPMDLPIIRLKVEYESDSQLVNSKRFGLQFIGKVANPDEILMFSRRRKVNAAVNLEYANTIEPGYRVAKEALNVNDNDLIENLTIRYAQKNGGLEIIDIKDFNTAIDMFVNKHDNHSIENLILNTISKSNLIFKKHKDLQTEDIIQLIRNKNNEKLRSENESKFNNHFISDELTDSDSEDEMKNPNGYNKRSIENRDIFNKRKSAKNGNREFLYCEWD